MRVLILCAGDGTRWENYLGVPKQLAPVDDVPILHRTVGMLRDRGVTDVRVVVKPGTGNLFAVDGATLEPARLDAANHEADRFCSSRHLWSTTGRTVILYGDVYYTDDAMDVIVNDPEAARAWRVYGRPKGSKLTGCAHGELFAFSWQPEHHAEIDSRLSYVIGLRRDGTINRALGWELFRALCGHTGRAVRQPRGTPFDRLVRIDDWTDDFDKPKQYQTWHYRRSERRRQVAVLVPWRSDGGPRAAAWQWVANRWRRKYPDWQLVVGHCPDGPWSKGAAVADAFSRTDAPVLVIADADVWCGGVHYAVDKVAIGQTKWAIPHWLVHRLSEHATRDLLDGAISYERIHKAPLAEKPYPGYPGGGITVVCRDLLERAPVDPRFVGWGHEDEAAAHAWTTLGGRAWRGTADLWHLWHPPAIRRSRAFGSSDSVRLLQQYRRASGNHAAMAQLITRAADPPKQDVAATPAPAAVDDASDQKGKPVKFVSLKYPNLAVPSINVRFRPVTTVDGVEVGVADVTTRGAIAHLQSPWMRRRGVALADEVDLEFADSPGAGQKSSPEPTAGVTSPPDGPPPAGPAGDVLAWVGDDPDRARRALEAEQARARPRTSLVAKLGKLAGPTTHDLTPASVTHTTTAAEV